MRSARVRKLTENFHQLAPYNVSQTPETIHEYYPYLGEVEARVYYPGTDPVFTEVAFSEKQHSYPEKSQHSSLPALACA